jgi:hypothetical protein
VKLEPTDPAIVALLEGPSAATLTIYREDGQAITSPVWPLFTGDAFEIVVGLGDPKLRHLKHDPRCVLTVFETVRPFRGFTMRSSVTSIEPDEGADLRRAVATLYLGEGDGIAYADPNRRPPGFRLRIPVGGARAWDLADILP